MADSAAVRSLAGLPRLPLGSMVLYAIGMLGYASIFRIVSQWAQKALVPPALSEQVVTIVWFTAVFAIARFYIDAVTDPVISYWSDHSRSRWGRRKPFILAGLIPGAICVVALFSLSPDSLFGLYTYPDAATAELVNGVLYAVLMTGFFVASTLIAMPYLAMMPEITPHPTDRRRLASMMGVFVILGIVVGQVLPPMFATWTEAALMVCGVAIASFAAVLLFFRYPEWARSGYHDSETVTVKPDGAAGYLTPGGGFRMLGQTMWFGLLVFLWSIAMLVVAPITVLRGGRVRILRSKRVGPRDVSMMPTTPPAPLQPLGDSLKHLLGFRPFLGFLGAFVALHSAFVLISSALPYIPQTLIGLDSAQTYHRYVTGGPLDLHGDPLLRMVYETGEVDPESGLDGPRLATDMAGEVLPFPPSLQAANGDGASGELIAFDTVVATASAAEFGARDDVVRSDAWIDAAAAQQVLDRMIAAAPTGRVTADAYGVELQKAGLFPDAAGIPAEAWHRAILGRIDGIGNMQATFYLAVALGTTLIIGVPLISLLLGWIGHRRTGLASLLLFMVGPLFVPLIALDGIGIAPYLIVYPLTFLIGIALAGIFVLDNLLLADVVEMDHHLTGERRESFFFGMYGLLQKMGIGLAIGVAGVLFDMAGFTYADPWGVRLAGPATSLILAMGLLIYLRRFPTDAEVARVRHGDTEPNVDTTRIMPTE